MQQVNLHQQKLYALLEAALALIGLFLTWMTASAGEGAYGLSKSTNGFGSWGLISVAGIVGVIVASLLGDKTKPYDAQGKMIALASFGAIAVGAIAYFIRIQTAGGQTQAGFYIIEVKTSAGPGLWMTLAAGLIGLAWVSGILSKMGNVPTTAATSSVPMPPSATPPPQSHNPPPPPPPPPPPSA